jgi:hypothetical protein
VHQVLNLTDGHRPLDPILWILHPSLKIANCREYLEPDAGLSGPMRNSNFIHSDLSASGPSTLSTFFTLETKRMGGRLVCVSPFNLVHLLHLRNKWNGGFLRTEGGKAAADMETLLMAIVWIKILQQKCDHRAPC